MTITTYARRQDIIAQEILAPLGEYANEHDVDAIADALIICEDNGLNAEFFIDPDADFWEVVAANAL